VSSANSKKGFNRFIAAAKPGFDFLVEVVDERSSALRCAGSRTSARHMSLCSTVLGAFKKFIGSSSSFSISKAILRIKNEIKEADP